MINKLRNKINAFISNKRDTPLLAACITALTPLLFYYSNNYQAVNSWEHLLFFSVVVFAVSFGIYGTIYYAVKALNKTYVKHALFWVTFFIIFFALYFTFFATFKRRIALVALCVILYFVLPFKPRKHYKKLLIMLSIFSLLSLFKVLLQIYEDLKPKPFLNIADGILEVKFKVTPNIYLIQPDGYVSEATMVNPPYNYNNNFYNWLRNNGFTVYNNFRSNYPASLTSNASLFSMKQHYFNKMMFPKIEMADAREMITTKNPVTQIFHSNAYETYFIARDEYFQQNRKQKAFDFFNIKKSEIPFFTKGESVVKDVFEELKLVMENEQNRPKFIFVEKLLPHHVAFYNTDASIKAERDRYIKNIKATNLWLKEVINYISVKDKNSIVIILADHGGWVGLKSFNDLFSNTSPQLVTSTFSALAAIKWNGHNTLHYDKQLKTNVNLFRVLFSVLSKTNYLDHLENDASYNLKINALGNYKVIKSIDSNGKVLTLDKE